MSDSQIKALMAHYELFNRNALTHVIRAAVSLGIIDALQEGQKTAEQLADELNLKPRPLQLMMDVLALTELIEKYDDDFALSTVARLIPREMMDFGDFHWSHLADFVKTGVNLHDDENVPATNADYMKTASASQWLWTPAALDAARVLDIGNSRTGLRILDVGCGTAVFSVTMAHRDPESRLTLLDTSSGLRHARKTVESMNLEDRVQMIDADYLDVDLDDQFDLIVMGGLLHRHSREECVRLFEMAKNHLKSKCELAVIDIFPGQEKGEVNRRIMELELNLRTSTGQFHEPLGLQRDLLQTGFMQIQYAPLPAEPHLWGLILAVRE